MSNVDDEQIWLLETNQRIDEMRGVLISAEEEQTKKISERTKKISELKEMVASLLNHRRPSYSREQGVRAIPSGTEQITRSSLLTDAQIGLELEELEQIETKKDPIVSQECIKIVAHQVFDESPKSQDCYEPELLGEEVVQIEIKDEPIVAKESIGLTAYQVFDEMPMLFDKGIELSDAFPKESEVLLDGTLDQEAPPLISEVEKDDSKIFGVCKAETELLNELEMKIGHVKVLCFDPGGGLLKLVSDSLDLRCCDRELTSEIYLCEVRLSGTDVNQSTLPASKSDQAKVGSGILLFDPGGEALLLGGDSHDVGVALAGRRYWKCTHVDLCDNAYMFPVYWTGYGVYQSCFLAFILQKVKVNSQLKWLVFDTLDIENHSTPEDSANEYGGKVPFDPGGGALSLNQEPITREKNDLRVTDEEWIDMAKLFISSSGIVMNQPAWVASKFVQAKVLIFDPGGKGFTLGECGINMSNGNEFSGLHLLLLGGYIAITSVPQVCIKVTLSDLFMKASKGCSQWLILYEDSEVLHYTAMVHCFDEHLVEDIFFINNQQQHLHPAVNNYQMMGGAASFGLGYYILSSTSAAAMPMDEEFAYNTCDLYKFGNTTRTSQRNFRTLILEVKDLLKDGVLLQC